MTLPGCEEINQQDQEMVKEKKSVPLSATLTTVLKRARDSDRIQCGVFECAEHLEQDPDTVMLCILPEATPDDLTTSIQHKLIEAYCLENQIVVIKVLNSENLATLLSKSETGQKTLNQNPVAMATVDCSCVLVNWPPKDTKNKHENRFLDDVWPNQVIQLPI